MKNYREAEEISLIFSGNNYFEVLEQMIDNSNETLHLQTYIFENDETGTRIIEALKRAAARGVKVYMLVDAYGSYPFSKKAAAELKEANIHFRLYSPLLSSESMYFGRRLHHKIIVADKKTALTGGINIANKYSGVRQNKAWLDYGVLTKGYVCEHLHLVCDMFYKKRGQKKLKAWEKLYDREKKTAAGKLVRFRINDWIKERNEIHKSYMEAIIGSQKCITIVASYFLPGRTFRKILKEAAARGVEIKIILAGKSDISTLLLAEHYMYNFYLKNNIRIYEWTNSVMHGKAMIVDKTWATIGSYNLNFLSHYISIELNTDIIDVEFVNTFAGHLDDVMINHCQAVELKKNDEKINAFQKIKMWVAYQFYRVLMSIAMAGRKYRKRKH